MTDDVSLRLAGVVALGLLGVALAVATSAIGVGTPAGESDVSGEFRVSENNLTFSDGTQEVTAVQNMSDVQAIEIADRNGKLTVNTERTGGLGPLERERAKEIALANETVQAYVETVEDYSITVEPIQQIEAEEATSITVKETEDPDATVLTNSSDESGFVVTTEDNESADSVTIQREPSYVDDQANVRLYGPSGDLQYSLVVDLATEQVTKSTDWSTVGDD